MCNNPKYNIKRRLLDVPGKFQHNKYKLCIEANITERTFDKYLDTEKSDEYSIPSDKLKAIATFFNCTMDQLING